MLAALSNKFGKVEFTHENNEHLFFKSEEFEIRVAKETDQDRHKVEIKDISDNDFGFHSTLEVWQV